MKLGDSQSDSMTNLFKLKWGKRILNNRLSFILIGLILLSAPRPAWGGTLRVLLRSESGAPIPGASVELTEGDSSISKGLSGDDGDVLFPSLPVGNYTVLVNRDGYQPQMKPGIAMTSNAQLEVEFRLFPQLKHQETMNVEAEATPVEAGASVPSELQRTQFNETPVRPSTVKDVLPLIPGVVRTMEDEIRISGSSENRSAFVVNGADVSDPATGQFGVSIPVDSVETINVFKTPYLAQFGRFSAGVVAVETRRGGEKWNFELNDPLPEFRIRSMHLMGVKDATPRVVLDGPLIPGKLYFSEGSEYILHKKPVRSLGYPDNEIKQESVNTYTQLDYIVSPTHLLTGSFHFSPGHTRWANLDYFNQRPVTPDFSRQDYNGTLVDRFTIKGQVLESLLNLKFIEADQWAQGTADMVMTPEGNKGNYFSEQRRDASRIEWAESLSLSPIKNKGTHNIRIGSDIIRTANSGSIIYRPVSIQDGLGNQLRRQEYLPGTPFQDIDLEVSAYGQDHWTINQRLAFDMGLRFEHQGITETTRVAPRFGVAFQPLKNTPTVIRAGIGVFYDRVPLNVYSFAGYPQTIITTYDMNGNVTDGPRLFYNVTETMVDKRLPFLQSEHVPGNFAPYSITWSAEVEHPVTPWLKVRANFLQGNSNGLINLAPGQIVAEGKTLDAMILSGSGRARYRQIELTSKMSWKEKHEIFFSYVRSQSHGQLNEFNKYLGYFPVPIVQPDVETNLSGDVPNRIVSWGLFKLPRTIRFSPLVEYRTGFPYAVTDAYQEYVGIPNSDSTRYPNFFSLDARVSKDFKFRKYLLRFAVRGLNLTNHFNPLTVHSNIADPMYGTFFGHYKRRFLVDFDFLY
jgi:hypothetical protein